MIFMSGLFSRKNTISLSKTHLQWKRTALINPRENCQIPLMPDFKSTFSLFSYLTRSTKHFYFPSPNLTFMSSPVIKLSKNIFDVWTHPMFIDF
jgi:hypothetical protein